MGGRAGEELSVAGFLLRTSECVEEPVTDALREVLVVGPQARCHSGEGHGQQHGGPAEAVKPELKR